jgi:DNA-binding Lrp family transcriptional regulator
MSKIRSKTKTREAAQHDEIVNVLKAQAENLAAQSPTPQVQEFSPGTGSGQSTSELSELEWRIIRLLLPKIGQPFGLSEITQNVGQPEVSAAIEKLVAAGILERYKGCYRITPVSRMKIPLFSEERDVLQAAEARIDIFVEEIYGKQMEIAKDLKTIRDGKLYRETHNRFRDYVEERFFRTRDWAYKLIQEFEVREGLKVGNGVGSLLQTVTAREIPILAKLKSKPEKMQEALRNAEEAAKRQNRERTLEDVQEAVDALKPREENEGKASASKAVRTVTIKGIEFAGGDIDNLPVFFANLAKWLRKHPAEKTFTIKVSKPGSKEAEAEAAAFN